MSTRGRWRARRHWRALLTKRRRPDDFTQEIAAHLDHEAAQLVAEGVAADEARLIARRRFGSVAAAEERFYESRRWMWLDRTRQDLRDAVRSLTRYPLAAAVGILSIAAGIGVTTATLTVRNTLFHNPPPEYSHAEELSEIRVARGTRPIMPIGSWAPGGLVAAWTAALGPSTIAAARPPQGVRDVRAGDRTEPVTVRAVTPELFEVLGVRPALGGTLTSASPAAVMLSDRVWRQWFDGRADAIGQTIWIENRPHTVVGVLPPRFWLSVMQSAVWTVLDRTALDAEDGLEVIVRRPAGMSHAALFQRLQPLLDEYAAHQPGDRRQLRMSVNAVEGTPMGKQMPLVLPWVLGTASFFTLLIACANVAILMIAQWTAREHEISIRASIGASRARLVRALLTESVVLAVCGGAIGVAVTLALRTLLVRRTGPGAFFDLSIHPAVFLQAAATTIAAGVFTGLAPALFETRRLYGNPMRVNAATEPVRQRWRHVLVVAEIGLTVALLVLTGAFVNSYRRSLTMDMGFPTAPLLAADATNPKGVPIDAVLGAIRSVPGVSSAAVSTTVPLTPSGQQRRPVGSDAGAASAVMADRGAVMPEFFSVLNVPIRAGRAFTSDERPAARVAILNEELARRLFGAPDATGRQVWMDGLAFDVVGVVANFSNSQFFREFEPRIFVPLETTPAPTRAIFVIRATGDPAPLVQAVRRAIRDAAPGNLVTRGFTFETIRTIGSQEALLGTAPLFPLIAFGLLLTMAGIYGVMAFSIARRSRELAVRLAIGATGRDLARLVAGNTARLVAIGAAFGLGATFVMSRIVRASGGAGSFLDPEWPAFAVTIVIISTVAAAAAWVPSRRARRIDPAVLLREI